jgi:hypothetical protein
MSQYINVLNFHILLPEGFVAFVVAASLVELNYSDVQNVRCGSGKPVTNISHVIFFRVP